MNCSVRPWGSAAEALCRGSLSLRVTSGLQYDDRKLIIAVHTDVYCVTVNVEISSHAVLEQYS